MGEERKTTALKCGTTDIESTGRKQLVTDIVAGWSGKQTT